VLLLRRAVAALRRAGHRLTLLAPAASGAALVGPGTAEVDALLPWDRADLAALLSDEGVPPGPLRDMLAGFDTAIAYTRSAALLAALEALVPTTLAHDPLPASDSGHASVWLARTAASLGAVIDDSELPAPCRATEAERVAAEGVLARLPRGFLAVHAGSGSPSKNWPARRFAALVERVSGGRSWLLVEGPADAASVTPLGAVPGAVVARRLPARILGAVLSRAGVLVGNDSGVSHLAAAWDAPTVALFGPTDPAVWAPLGEHVRVVRSGNGSMEGIGIDEVVAATSAALELPSG